MLSQPGVYERMHRHGQAIRDTLERGDGPHGRPLVTTGVGTVFSAHFGLSEPPRNYRDTLKTDMAAYTRFRAAMLARGVQLLPDGRWYVGAAHTDRELELVLPAIDQCLSQ